MISAPSFKANVDVEAPTSGTPAVVDHFRRNPIVFEVSGAEFSVDGKNKILDDVSLTAQSGELVAIMGPSGAGKTTLLDFMALRLSRGEATGSVTVNGRPLDFETFRQHAVYVEQCDEHWAFLTCQEIMEYAAALCIPGCRAEQLQRVDHVMQKFGLQECANTRSGNMFFKGLSGGQRKRLSLGMAVLKAPVLMLLDEPTSGLDAASASSVIAALKEVCVNSNVVAITTIHQPSQAVFHEFSQVMFMANGRTAYYGETANLSEYCASIGRLISSDANPAECFLELLNSEFADRQQVDVIVKAWCNRHVRHSTLNHAQLDQRWKQSIVQQTRTILSRQGLLALRDPTLYTGRAAAFFAVNGFFALVYWNVREYEQMHAYPKFMLTGWFTAVTTMLSVVVVLATNAEFCLMEKEIKNGLVKRGPYLVASGILTISVMFFLSVCALLVPALLANWSVDCIAPGIAILAVTLWTFECVAQFFGVFFRNPLVGMLAVMALWFSSFLLNGFFLREDLISPPFSMFVRFLPIRWATEGLTYSVFHASVWEGAVPSNSGRGFVCPNLPDLLCQGHTGAQVLTSLQYHFSNVNPNDTTWLCIRRIFLIGLFFKVCHIVAVLVRSRGSLRDQATCRQQSCSLRRTTK
jgi:ABC-type multidrug transport system ATPase subunit